jgi:hypothetical protein
MKIHLHRDDRHTWCGRKIVRNTDGTPNAVQADHATRDRFEAGCLVCLMADLAEQTKEDAASR